MRRLYIATFVGFACIAGAAMIVWYLSWQPPSWYRPPEGSEESVSRMADRAEFRLVEEFQKIRQPEETWRLRIGDDAMNAWLATRLAAWLTHEHELTLPEEVSTPQVHVTEDGVWLGAMVDMGEASRRPLAVRIRLTVQNEDLLVEPDAIRVGRMPVPLFSFRGMLERASGELPSVDSVVELMDDRTVQILAIDLEPGAMILTLRTLP
ncbi:MAG: hypothetical protein QGH76_03495 [Phycisphaerales bacterium]|jgi:hypothetical protein|nr:hypothetical protein [Phycisphaerales bacterium]